MIMRNQQRSRDTGQKCRKMRALAMYFIINMIVLFGPKNAFASVGKILIQRQLVTLEKEYGGRLGIYAIDTGNDFIIAYNAKQRFPICSISKVMSVAAILKQSMQAPSLLNQNIRYSKTRLISSGYAPITRKHIHTGMRIKSLCDAAVSYSDNTAANLLMQRLGGPKAVTAFARSIGDSKFYLVRWEPELNAAIPGDKRDTSTPKAMSQSLQKLVLEDVLAVKQRKHLADWLIKNTTGSTRIRAGVPRSWVVGDKTGTGNYGTTNDVAVIWPPKCKPIILSIYYTQASKNARPNDEVLTKATHDIMKTFAQHDACLAADAINSPLDYKPCKLNR